MALAPPAVVPLAVVPGVPRGAILRRAPQGTEKPQETEEEAPGALATLGGALLGEFNENATTSMIVVDTLISLIPIADQIADARDIAANVYFMLEKDEYAEPSRWLNLALTLLGAVPELGSALKGVAKLAVKKGGALLGHLDGLLALIRKLLPESFDLSRIRGWIGQQWPGWKRTATDVLTGFLSKAKAWISFVPEFILAAKNRWLKALTEIEKRLETFLSGVLDTVLKKVEDACSWILTHLGIGPDTVSHGLSPQPALATAMSGEGVKDVNKISTNEACPAAVRVGHSAAKNYRAKFFAAHPELKGKVVVHHGVEQQVLKRYPGLFSESEMHALENLRGIPLDLNDSLHLREIRRSWTEFYRNHQFATREDIVKHVAKIDRAFGKKFLPPIG